MIITSSEEIWSKCSISSITWHESGALNIYNHTSIYISSLLVSYLKHDWTIISLLIYFNMWIPGTIPTLTLTYLLTDHHRSHQFHKTFTYIMIIIYDNLGGNMIKMHHIINNLSWKYKILHYINTILPSSISPFH